jgi:hypothetical protein
VHQYIRTTFSENGERGTKSIDWFAAQHCQRDGLFDSKNFRHICNGISALAPGPNYLVNGPRLRGNQIFKQSRVTAPFIKLRHCVDAASLISLRSCASVIR